MVLLAGGLAVCAGPLLHSVGLSGAALSASRAGGLVAVALAATALVRHGRRTPGRSARPWLLIAAVAALEGLWQVGESFPQSRLDGFGDVQHLIAALVLTVALWLLPAPVEDRHGLVRTAMDAAAAGFAFAVPSWELLDRDWGGGTLLAQLSTVAHPTVNVMLASAAVAVLARARRGGGLTFPPLLAMTLGAGLLAVADMVEHGAYHGLLVPAMVGLALVSFAAGGLCSDMGESEVIARWRERFAVLVPLAPLSGAGALMLSAAISGARLSNITLVFAVLLLLTLVAGGVVARLDGIAVERSLDDLVLKRTITLGTREKWFRSLVQNSSDVITVVDVRGVVRYQTPSVTRILGHDPHLLVGTRFSGLLRPIDGRKLEAALSAASRKPGRTVTLEFPIWHKSGHWCDTETTITSLVHDPDIRGLVLNSRDVSERRQLEEALTHQAFSDPLTGLANRALFRQEVESALADAFAPGEVAVLFLDLNGFKAVNDAQGHHVGDELLGLVSKRLAHSVRPGDLVARLGGDEFGILVSGAGAEEGAVWVAERVRRALAAPFLLDGREMTLGASTGIAVVDDDDQTADQLLRNADLAMYRAKSRHDLSFVRFEAQMHDALLARVRAESDLRQAVVHGDLVLHYQPVVELSSGRIVGAEALVRWRHAERGLIQPSDFIELAEETGLVNEIGSWALTECCAQGARWQRYAAPGGFFKIAVNVSARQLEVGLPRQLRDALAESGLPGQALTLEMTESVLMERTEDSVELLRRLKTIGVKVAVDDFGTGYSSLSYLSRFPVDILKIDRSFVQNIGGDDPGSAELVTTIVRLGESLRLETVAEGIETDQQRDLLRDLGCTYGQGFLFARPMAAEDLDALLADDAGGEAMRRGGEPSGVVEIAAS
jgi:diguanylate cyclase (GGDEF)-like protein/PAS domain S-box-containing protein